MLNTACATADHAGAKEADTEGVVVRLGCQSSRRRPDRRRFDVCEVFISTSFDRGRLHSGAYVLGRAVFDQRADRCSGRLGLYGHGVRDHHRAGVVEATTEVTAPGLGNHHRYCGLVHLAQ